MLLGLMLLLAPAIQGIPSAADAERVGALASPAILDSPPSATTAFLAAYARGDESAADSLASPLYRAGWEQRGLSAEERAAIRLGPSSQRGPLRARLSFTYIGGVVDGWGFGHLLFVARPTKANGPVSPSAFRVDVSPSGQVIWLEMVWLFAQGTGTIHAVADDDLARAPLPPVPCCARAILGVAADDGRSAYYAYTVPLLGATQPDVSAPATVGFYAVDSDGLVRPGAWTYGQADEPPMPYGEGGRSGHRALRVGWHLQPDDSALLDAYLASLALQH